LTVSGLSGCGCRLGQRFRRGGQGLWPPQKVGEEGGEGQENRDDAQQNSARDFDRPVSLFFKRALRLRQPGQPAGAALALGLLQRVQNI
jgi:hypothetical protein